MTGELILPYARLAVAVNIQNLAANMSNMKEHAQVTKTADQSSR